MQPSALITGITGQDGAYLANLLLNKGYSVVGLSPRRSTPCYWRLEELGIRDEIDLRSGDITCPASTTATIADGQFDEVYNLAAMSFVAESFRSPVATANINYIGVLNLLEAIRTRSHETRFYQASTSEMFGSVNVEAQDESTPFHPRSPYGVSKVAAHWATINYREAYNLHASCGILFNHESPLRGEEFVTRKVTKGLGNIEAGKQTQIMLGNTQARRDWGHAKDFTRAMWMMLQAPTPDDYVVATGHTHSVQEFIAAACRYTGAVPSEVIGSDPRYLRPSDVPLLCGDPTKIRDKLGWEPEYNFKDLVDEMMYHDCRRAGV